MQITYRKKKYYFSFDSTIGTCCNKLASLKLFVFNRTVVPRS